MDIRRLRTLTILGPIAFLVVLELIGILVLRPALGQHSLARLLIIFAVLAAAVVPFSFWVFATLERQQRQLVQSHAELEQRVVELRQAHEIAAERNRQLDAVNTAIHSISRAIALEHVLQNITEAARALIHCRYAALGVADEQGHILHFITSGISPGQRAAIGPLPQGHGLLGFLIREARPLRIANIAGHPESHGFPPNHPPMTSLLGVPILFQGKPVGDLYLTDKIGSPEFSQEDQELLLLLANHAAVAIENARLYEDARSARDRLQVWNDQLEGIVAERTREIERYSRETTTRILQAQEDERKRIARELHDDTAQSLSTLLITLDLVEAALPADDPAVQTSFNRIRAIAKRTLDEVRALSHDLRPTILDDFGLEAALQWYADECALTFGVPISVDIEQTAHAPLAPEVELALFRITQEALTNSGKYANASRIRLALAFPDSSVRLVVEDNGRGFDPAAARNPTRQGGLGLFGMRERAELLDARLTIESAPGRGTKITAIVPLHDAEAVTNGNGASPC